MFDDLKSKYSTWYDDIIKRGCLVIGNMEKCKIEKGDVKRDMTKNVEKNVTKKKNIKWNDIFDSIWCISFTGYPERKKGMESEFKRLGILNSGVFNWRFTFPTIFDNILFDVTKKQLKHNDCINVSSMSCSLGHYGCIKTAYELGHEFALFMEDDIRFLKNVEDIDTIVKSIPPCADVVNFDVLPTESRYTKDNYGALMEKNSYNDHFFRYDGEILWGASCYALSRKAMERILQRYEQMLYVADGYTSGKIFLGKDVSYFASKESICCQLTFGKSVNAMIFGNNALHGVYSKKSLDYSKYNIFAAAGLQGKVWQYFTVVPDMKSTGIKNGKRTDDWMVIIRAVNSVDAVTASIEEVPYPLLLKIRDRIFKEVKGVNRVLYDLSSKPLATIEYE